MSATNAAEPPPGSWRRRLGLTRGAVAAIATMMAVGVAVGLMPPLIALNLAADGVSERIIGVLVAIVALASLAITPLASRIAARFGTVQVIILCTLAAAIVILTVSATRNIVLLFPILFVYGTALTLCFTLSEFWINAVTADTHRGLVMGIYATMLSIGFAIGPGIIAVLGYATVWPFLVGATVMVASAVPAFLARDVSPDFKAAPRRPFFAYIFAVPAATFGVFVFANAEQSGFAFLPLWGQHINYDASMAVLLASAMTLGNVMFQIPIGLIADRIDRRIVLLGCGTMGVLGMALAWVASGSPASLMPVLFIWGGASAGLYTVGLAHLASRFSGAELASANAAFVFCYALGMLVGPIITGDAVERAPTYGFPLAVGAIFALYVLIVAARIISDRRRTPAAGA